MRKLSSINSNLSNAKVIPVFQTLKTQSFFANKDKIPVFLRSNVVYKFTCEHCTACYIGETRRHLITRINEHLSGKPVPSELSLHEHECKRENFTLLQCTPYTMIAESLHIARHKNTHLLNEKQSSLPLMLFRHFSI